MEIEEVIGLMDNLKEEMRNQFITKLDLDKFESRLSDLEEDLDQLHLTVEIDQKKIKELVEVKDDHQTRITNCLEYIVDLQNDVSALKEQIKLKAEGEEIDSV